MNEADLTLTCLNCAQPETKVPLVALRYAGQQRWVCSQCLPILIHHPERLGDKLGNDPILPSLEVD
ncbi:MAG: hypothetical protein KC413_02625 [Anaerolineales bacterium]|nr:hypothetical protein [Anaerolineales bacterium]